VALFTNRRSPLGAGNRKIGRLRISILSSLLLLVGIFGAVLTASSSASASGTSIPKAQAALKSLEVRPTKIGVSTPITKPIPKGKTIDWLVCGSPDCTVLTAPLTAAAKALGWTLVPVPEGLTPETVLDAWNTVVQNHPDGVITAGFPESLFSSDLATLKSENVPVVDGFVTDPVGNGIVAMVNGGNSYSYAGAALADFVLGKEGTKADALFVGGTTFPASTFEENAFLKQFKALCPTCKSSTLNEPATAIGAALTSSITGTLTRNPGVNFVVASQPSQADGLPQAMKSAGLTAKIVVNSPDATTVQYLKEGLIAGIMDVPNTDEMPQMIDAMARDFVGASVAPDEVKAGDWAADTASAAGQIHSPYFLVKGYLGQFEKLWK
jgi:ABC-type sugar transport system substrate-binding protein